MAARSWFLVLCLGLFAAEQSGLAADTRTILQAHCLNCHSTKEQKGDLDLEKSDIHKEPYIWENLLDQIAMGEMPPKKEKQLCPPQIGSIGHSKKHLSHFS